MLLCHPTIDMAHNPTSIIALLGVDLDWLNDVQHVELFWDKSIQFITLE
jgi:hypothetical protein